MLSILTPPYAAPVDVSEARAHVRAGSSEDARLRRMIRGCARWAQTQLQRTIIATRLVYTADCFGCGCIDLEFGPVQRVLSVNYLDTAGVWQTLSASAYVVDLSGPLARVVPAYGTAWPAVQQQPGAVRVVFDAGYAVPIVADAAANTITLRGSWPDLAVNASVRLSNSGGVLPAPLQPDVDYYVQQVVSPGVYKLSATAGGVALDLSDAGSGTHFVGEVPDNVVNWILLRVASLFENRESEVQLDRGTLVPLPYIDRLLDGDAVINY